MAGAELQLKIYQLLFVCFLFVSLFSTVMNFSAEDKASGVKFCSAIHRRPRHGIAHFCELCSPEAAQNPTNRRAREPRPPACININAEMRRRKRHARDAPFVDYRAACGSGIMMCVQKCTKKKSRTRMTTTMINSTTRRSRRPVRDVICLFFIYLRRGLKVVHDVLTRLCSVIIVCRRSNSKTLWKFVS